MNVSRPLRTAAVCGACALAGAGAGIAGSDAHSGRHHGNFGRAARAPVHAELVLPDRQGGFRTVTLDRGSVESVSGDQLTVKEGTRTATYKTITLTIPADAKVRRNREDAKLSDLQQGDRVWVLQSGDKTFVKAVSAR
ncbi:MAG TPA: hypothetical protein VGJ70_26205 [Solirubrobacteraceae bacterium]